jgi:hypothetical protein
MSSENICEYCQKSFNSKYNFSRHITTCKKNPNKQITITYTESDMLRKEIELLEKQLKDKDQQLKDKDFIILTLQSQKNIPVQKLSNQKLSNEEPDKAVEPKYKTPIDKYIHIDCKEALNFDTLIKFAKDNFTLQDFKSIVLQKYEKKYISMLKKLLEKIPKKNMPIQIKTNKLNNEEGYIKIGDNFERYFRAELYDQFKLLIGGNGRNNLSNILQCLLSDYKDLDECEFTESESVFANMSIIGFEEFDNETGIDKFPKKLLTLNRNILDLFMVNL